MGSVTAVGVHWCAVLWGGSAVGSVGVGVGGRVWMANWQRFLTHF